MKPQKASLIHVGGFRPTAEALATHFGMKPVGTTGESWPVATDGTPLLFVCQLNLTGAPEKPEVFQDVALVTLFVKPDQAAYAPESGTDWVLRAYPTLDGLATLDPPPNTPRLRRGAECTWESITDRRDPSDRSKVGGVPCEVQSEPWWDLQAHEAAPAFCLQISNEDKAGLAWGDGGIVFIARGTAEGHRHRWFLDLQAY